jgi:hypothetical protein
LAPNALRNGRVLVPHLRSGLAERGGVHAKRQYVLGGVTRFGVSKLIQAPTKRCCTDEEPETKCNLAGNEDITELPTAPNYGSALAV